MLEGRQLSAVVFVQDYIQLQFDGATINAYVWPNIALENRVIGPDTPGYRDALCGQIGKLVIEGVEEPEQGLALVLSNGTVVEISLREKDRTSAEAALFSDETTRVWNVW